MTDEKKTIANILHQTAVDVKISKADLVDMVVAERDQELQNEISRLEDEIGAVTTNLKEEDTKHEAALKTLFTKMHGKEIKAVEKVFGTEAVLAVQRPSSDQRAFQAPMVLSTFSASYGMMPAPAPYGDPWSGNKKDSVKVSDWNVWKTVTCIVEKKSNCESGKWMLVFEATDDVLITMPTFKRIKELADRRQSFKEELKIATNEKQNLHNMGSQAKAKLVRAILESTDEGKNLLTTMSGAIKTGIKALKSAN